MYLLSNKIHKKLLHTTDRFKINISSETHSTIKSTTIITLKIIHKVNKELQGKCLKKKLSFTSLPFFILGALFIIVGYTCPYRLQPLSAKFTNKNTSHWWIRFVKNTIIITYVTFSWAQIVRFRTLIGRLRSRW